MSCPVLRDYQTDLIERGRARHREGAKRVLFQAATGSGKTHIAAEIVRGAWRKGRRVLLVAHRRRLIDQIGERLGWFGIPYGTVMAGVAPTPGPVQVASRDTLLSRGELPPADFVIVDEAHNCLANQYMALLERYPDAWVDGFTATPARSDGRGLGEFYEALECAVPTSRLVADGHLVPVRCYAPEHKGKGKKRGLAGDPVIHWQRYAGGRPTVLFASTVATSMAAKNAFLTAGIPAAHIDAHTPDEERDRVIAALKTGGVQIVCNVGVWTEGVDVPELSCCVLLRLAGSYVLFAQAVGRIMRAHPGKTDAVLIDHAGAVYKHGFPDEDVEWSLDTEDSVDRRVRQDKKDGRRKEPIVCPRCAFLFSGSPTCPSCGHVLVRRPKVEMREDESLVEVARRGAQSVAFEERERFWHRCLAIMANKGRTAGAAAHMYRQKFGDWPDNGFRNVPHGSDWKREVGDLYPQYIKRAMA